jgi:hypothetical protein
MRHVLKLWFLAVLLASSRATDTPTPPVYQQSPEQLKEPATPNIQDPWLAKTAAPASAVDLEAWTTTSTHYIRVFARATRLLALTVNLPDTDATRARAMALAAIAEETPRAPAPLLVALAWPESRFDQLATPLCGVLQVNPVDIGRPASDCAILRRDLRRAVQAGVTEIEMMLDDHRVAGDVRRMLLYRACGNAAFNGTCSPKKYVWVDNALALYHRLEREIARLPTS